MKKQPTHDCIDIRIILYYINSFYIITYYIVLYHIKVHQYIKYKYRSSLTMNVMKVYSFPQNHKHPETPCFSTGSFHFSAARPSWPVR